MLPAGALPQKRTFYKIAGVHPYTRVCWIYCLEFTWPWQILRLYIQSPMFSGWVLLCQRHIRSFQLSWGWTAFQASQFCASYCQYQIFTSGMQALSTLQVLNRYIMCSIRAAWMSNQFSVSAGLAAGQGLWAIAADDDYHHHPHGLSCIISCCTL